MADRISDARLAEMIIDLEHSASFFNDVKAALEELRCYRREMPYTPQQVSEFINYRHSLMGTGLPRPRIT